LCAWFDIDDLNNIDVVDDLKEKIKMIKSRWYIWKKEFLLVIN
jgi:hypothetical protein